MLYTLPDKPAPQIAPGSFIAPSADIIGWVEIGEQASVWFNCVLRGDHEQIAIGARSNVQDSSVLHTDPGCPLTIADDVTVGHSTMLHGCTIAQGCLIGIGSVILNHAVIQENSLVGANSLITEHKTFPPGSLIIGSPARRVRALTAPELAALAQSAATYVANIARYRHLDAVGTK